jgi:MFS family permease
MGDVIGENGRGKYFAKRNLYNNIIALSGTMLIALILDWYKARDQVFIGFAVVFLIGFITRVFSVLFFTQHYYPPFKFEASDHVSLHKFIAELPKSNFGKFTTFVALLVFGQWIAGPFFSVYMLNELNFSYTDLIMVNLSTSVFGLFFFTIFGKIGDKYGNVFLMRIGAIIIPLLPLMWLFLDTPWGLILGPQLLGGIGWTAFNLATSNFIYDNIPSKKRGEYVALYNFFLGIGVITGGLIGSFLIEFMPISFISNILFVFLLSGIVRGIVVIIYLPQIREIRNISVRPIFNLKGNLIYKWLHDLLLREHGKARKNHRNNL